MKVARLGDIAMARSGDKGSLSNVGVWVSDVEDYERLRTWLTAERVAEHFAALCSGHVERYELPHLRALNFVLRDSLDGGGTVSLRSDAQGKVLSEAILMMELRDFPARTGNP